MATTTENIGDDANTGDAGAPLAVVIGAGIGGPVAALALRRAGWRVRVDERAAALDPVGSALSLAPNALRSLDRLGVGDDVRALAGSAPSGALRRPSGRVLARADISGFAREYGDPIMLLPRSDLVATLVAALSGAAPGEPDGRSAPLLARERASHVIRLGSPITVLDPGDPAAGGRRATLGTEAGEITADLVVAADGLRSTTRAALFPEHPGLVYAGCTTWRLLAPATPGTTTTTPPSTEDAPPTRETLPTGEPLPTGETLPIGDTLPIGETWGRGALTGVMPLRDGRVYVYAAAWLPNGGSAHDGDERAELLRRFGAWHAPIPALLRSVAPDQVLRHDVWELARPLPAYHSGRVVLLGDAAHPMTPFQGQGACQAIEDAVVLANELMSRQVSSGGRMAEALAAYSAARLPRTSMVVRRSRQIGRLIGLRGAASTTLRDVLLALAGRLPDRVAMRQAARLVDWRPPDLAEPGR